MDLTEAEDIKKRWQEYTEELCKKDPDNYDAVITDLERDILECEVNWALESSPFTTATERLKYVGIYLPKETKDLYIEN